MNPGIHNHNNAVNLFVLFSLHTLITSLDTGGKNHFFRTDELTCEISGPPL